MIDDMPDGNPVPEPDVVQQNKPRKYEITTNSFQGKPRGDTVILDANSALVKAALNEGAIRVMNEPASIDDDTH